MTVETTNDEQTEVTNQKTVTQLSALDAEALAKLVQEQVDLNLKPIKEKLDKAYSERDAAKTKVTEFEKAKREAELALLEEQGKHKEAFELRLAEEKTAREAAERRNVELTRDLEVRNALNAQPFRNDKAVNMAYSEIVTQLVQNEQGNWVHRSGKSIKEAIDAFAVNDDNAFLFKPKTSSGAGSTQSRTATGTGTETKTSLFAMSQDAVLKMAKEGKLRK